MDKSLGVGFGSRCSVCVLRLVLSMEPGRVVVGCTEVEVQAWKVRYDFHLRCLSGDSCDYCGSGERRSGRRRSRSVYLAKGSAHRL